jgi:hypothetical protein
MASKQVRANEFKHGSRLMQGKCFDCSQGMLSPAKDGLNIGMKTRRNTVFGFADTVDPIT